VEEYRFRYKRDFLRLGDKAYSPIVGFRDFLPRAGAIAPPTHFSSTTHATTPLPRYHVPFNSMGFSLHAKNKRAAARIAGVNSSVVLCSSALAGNLLPVQAGRKLFYSLSRIRPPPPSMYLYLAQTHVTLNRSAKPGSPSNSRRIHSRPKHKHGGLNLNQLSGWFSLCAATEKNCGLRHLASACLRISRWLRRLVNRTLTNYRLGAPADRSGL